MQPSNTLPIIGTSVHTFISSLLCPSSPPQIAGFVVPVVVDTVKAMQGSGACPYVVQNPFCKCPNRRKPKLDAPPPIICKRAAVRVSTSLLCPAPVFDIACNEASPNCLRRGSLATRALFTVAATEDAFVAATIRCATGTFKAFNRDEQDRQQ